MTEKVVGLFLKEPLLGKFHVIYGEVNGSAYIYLNVSSWDTKINSVSTTLPEYIISSAIAYEFIDGQLKQGNAPATEFNIPFFNVQAIADAPSNIVEEIKKLKLSIQAARTIK